MKDHTDFYKQVGEKIHKTRTVRQVSQEDLAGAIGLQRTSISNIEKGRQKLLLHTFYEIADTLRAEPQNLLPQSMKEQPVQATTKKALQKLPKEEREFVTRGAGLQENVVSVKTKKRR